MQLLFMSLGWNPYMGQIIFLQNTQWNKLSQELSPDLMCFFKTAYLWESVSALFVRDEFAKPFGIE